MDRGIQQAAVHGAAKDSDTTWQLHSKNHLAEWGSGCGAAY